mmetsp:Transcript_6032/g.10891  ORF Transcript_6032/g.10891 Transcript_6032/m.10891 type:complete len:311 (+) Transcript_6032:98-1030(+)
MTLDAVRLLRLLDEVQENEGEGDVRRNPDAVGGVAGVKGQWALLGESLHGAVQRALVRHGAVRRGLHLLDPCLHKVEGQRKGGRHHARGAGTGHHRLLLRLLPPQVLHEHLLELIVGGKHSHVESHSAHNGGPTARKPPADALVLGDLEESIKGVLVATALSEGQGAVCLHADEGKICWVAHDGAQSAGSQAARSLSRKRQVLAVIVRDRSVADLVVEPKARGGVGCLTQQAGGETPVERTEALLFDQLGSNGDRGSLGAQLEAHFDHIDGLNDAGGHHARHAAIEKWLGGLPGAVVTHLSGTCTVKRGS